MNAGSADPDLTPVKRRVDATVDEVWAVLCDGWLYPLWVVGASRMRDVDRDWPRPGSRLHHSVGSWPLLLDDNTEVLSLIDTKELRLKARAWPAGEAEVRICLEASGSGTLVTILEDASGGPGTLVPQPLRQMAITRRNVESLRRLAFVAEGRSARGQPGP